MNSNETRKMKQNGAPRRGFKSRASRTSRATSSTSAASARSNKLEKTYNIPVSQINALINNDRALEAWKYASKAIVGGDVNTDDLNLVNLAIEDLENRVIILEKDGFVTEAAHIKAAINRIKTKQIDLNSKHQNKQAIEQLSLKLQKVENFDAKGNLKINEKLDELNKKLDTQREAMKHKHKVELENLEKDWKSESRWRRYAHMSGQLRELRRQEDILLVQRKMMEYQRVRDAGDKLEEKETQNAMNKWETDYNSAKQLLLNKHRIELKTFEQAAENKRQTIRAQFERQSEIIERKKKAIEIQDQNAKEQIRSWARKMRNSIGPIAPPNAPATSRRAPRSLNYLKLPPLKAQAMNF